MKISASSVPQSGLVAASTALAVSANNVANAMSTDFVPSRAELSDVEGGGVQVSISNAARDGASGTDFVQEAASQSAAVAAYRANLKSLQAVDDTTGVVVSLGGER